MLTNTLVGEYEPSIYDIASPLHLHPVWRGRPFFSSAFIPAVVDARYNSQRPVDFQHVFNAYYTHPSRVPVSVFGRV